MRQILILISVILSTGELSAQPEGSVRDVDGNTYTTVVIGNQVWLAENLKTTRFNDETAIPVVTDREQFIYTFSPACTWYNNDKDSYHSQYGALYNWYAVNTGKLCPQGWHVPTDAEWSELTAYLGGKTIAGGKLKSTGTEIIRKETGEKQIERDQPNYVPDREEESESAVPGDEVVSAWDSPNAGATNSSGFNALPGGLLERNQTNVFFSFMGTYGFWWTETESSPAVAWYRLLYFNNSHLSRLNFGKNQGLSIRCVKD
jgi:uncharacterized protein (TIGR02145 family)